jgi:hypothetical protein
MQDDITAIEQEIAAFEKEQAECVARIRALQAEEDPVNGVFRHAEIHAAKQDKLRLDTEIQFCKNRINRRRLG